MARKREPVDDAGQRLLQSKLKLLQGIRGERANLALDILTGRSTAPVLEGVPEEAPLVERPEPQPEAPAPAAETNAPAPRAPAAAPRAQVVARTVYLSPEDMANVDFIVRAWRRKLHKRVSRSEVLRQAIGSLRDAVELGAAPRGSGQQ